MHNTLRDHSRKIYLGSSLYECIEDNNISAVEVLLKEHNADPNYILPDKGIAPFHLAIGNPVETTAEKITKLFLRYGGDPNVRSDESLTPVHVAAAWGRVHLLDLLLKCGGDPFLQDDENKTPLDYAQQEEHFTIISLLENYSKKLYHETYDNNYNLTLEKIIINNGVMVAEYDAHNSKNDTISNIKNILKPVTEHDTNLYVKNWCLEHAEIIDNRNFCIDYKVADHTFIIDSKNDRNVNTKRRIKYFDTACKKENELSNVNGDKNALVVCKDSFTALSDDSFVENVSRESGLHTIPSDSSCSLNNSLEPLNKSFLFNDLLNFSKSKINILNGNIKNTFDSVNNVSNIKTSVSSTQYNTCNEIVSNTNESFLITSDNESNEILNKCALNDLEITEDFSEVHETKNHPTGISFQVSVCSHSSSDDTFVSVTEEYKYTDEKEGIVLIERRFLVAPKICPEDNKSLFSTNTIASSLPTTIDYDTDSLRRQLVYCGEEPGPITKSTKRVYLKKLMKLQKTLIVDDCPIVKKGIKVYSVELEKTLRNPNWYEDLTVYKDLESQLAKQFSNPDPSKKWREGISKASFTYLLLDPRVTRNLPSRADKMDIEEMWSTFLSSIFYVGKGKRSRPYSHLYEAISHWNDGVCSKQNKKIQHILDIWSEGQGVVCLHIFQNVIPVEAYTREAAMISAIKLQNLKNSKMGDFYGIVATWPQKQKRLLGVYLLYKAMLIFLSEGERHLRPDDIDQ